jgi:phosphohistidine phosphatase
LYSVYNSGWMQIYLLRHGIAEEGKPGHPDSDRELTGEGRDKLRRVLKRARIAEVAPSLLLASPYKRAVETAEIAADVLNYEGKIVRTRALIPDASPYDLWEEIRTHKDEDAILLASHEPLMSSAISFLLNSPALAVDMKKAALVRIDVAQTTPEPHGILKWMLTPALVE